MAINDSDKFLINDGTKTETITFAQFKDGTVLNDSDKFLINDGTKTETITWAEIEDEIGPNGIVNTPVVLKPDDGAGSGDTRYLKSGVITQVGGSGTVLCETDTIQSVVETKKVWSSFCSMPAGFNQLHGFDGDINTFSTQRNPGKTDIWRRRHSADRRYSVL